MDQAAVDEAGSWLTAILTDSEPLVTARQAAVVTEILDAIYTSAATGKPVYFNES
jgi:predicted dehydrogenase